jgi:hypothetical protein
MWSRGHYARGWPEQGHSFWSERSAGLTEHANADGDLFRRFRREIAAQSEIAERPAIPPSSDWQSGALSLCAEIRTVEACCVRGDLVGRELAVTHPNLRRPVRFVDGQDLVELLRTIPPRSTAGDIVRTWSSRIEPASAAKIATWLIANRLLIS